MSIYNRSPIFLQNLFTTLQGYRYKRERFGPAYYQALEELKRRDYTDAAALAREQDRRTAELVRYAAAHTPFYREYYRDVDLSRITGAQDLRLLPVLPKETVRQSLDEMYAVSPAEGIESNTSGTTGTSLRFYYTKEDLQRRLAYLDFFKAQHGFIAMKMKRASFNSSKIVPPGQKKKIFWRTNRAIRQRIYSGYHCKGENVRYYVEDLNRFKPASLDGYPSAMYELARYILDNNVQLSFTPVAIFPTAETLLPHYKAAIEKAFRCPVRDQYASSEGAPFITECRCGRLHYCMDTGVIEFGEDGEMTVTCFESHGTPLIRYRIGDRAFLAEEQRCPCGSALPVVSRIEGRTMDYIQSPRNGKFTSIYMSLVSAGFSNSVKAMQFVQDRPDAVEVRLVADERYTPDMDRIILDKLHYSLGEEMHISIRRVEALERDPSGKVKLIINRLAAPAKMTGNTKE